MKTAAFPAPSIPAPAFALAAAPALVTVAAVGLFIALAGGITPRDLAPGSKDPFQIWTDKGGVAREMSLVGVVHDLSGSHAEFRTRDGATLSYPVDVLQAADRERAWDAAFATEPVLSFHGATIRKGAKHEFRGGGDHEVRYSFGVMGPPVRTVYEGTLRINRVPISGLGGMTIWPGDWSVELNRSKHRNRLDLVATGLFDPQSFHGAGAEGSVLAVCTDDVSEEMVHMSVPPSFGGSSNAQVGPFDLVIERHSGGHLALRVGGGAPEQVVSAGFLGNWPDLSARTTDVKPGVERIAVVVKYYRRFKEVELRFSGTAE